MTEPPVAGLLLAAGGGRRLGGAAKALLTFEGRTFVERTAAALRAAGCDPVHVVVGAAGDEVRARLDGYTVVANPGWESGMGSSLRAGLASLDGTGAGGALVALVDQPWVGAAAMARVLAAYRSPGTLAQAVYGPRGRGHPVLIGADHFAGVARAARGDRGARAYLRERAGEITLVECGDVAAPDDIDEPGDLIDLPQ
ncbi:nucleotidyltransferase family protein [Streptomyces sp. NBC_01803]|uniref:nucleotidyltransferase family protein n=1 Tax=Streptomyces sp. NBC_01803 TaxID=2975946 RepID=UPI002DD98C83|nr:nucleotidyltransferase family protein [Streptomyces sp. NBC_01803]WSA43734.1 nucleotidyltransferase family protein [Streptomyces sp. NBC_01803]